jgi:hypothetical protein
MLHSTHQYVVDGNVNQLHEEADEPHDHEAQTCGASDLGKLCGARYGRMWEDVEGSEISGQSQA